MRLARAELAIALVLAAACASEPAAPEPPPSPARRFATDPGAVARGRSLFLGTCTGYCHGGPRGGGRDAPDLFDCTWLHGSSDEAIFATISGGVPGTAMLAFGGRLADDDLWRLVAYLRSASRCPQAPSASYAQARTSSVQQDLRAITGEAPSP